MNTFLAILAILLGLIGIIGSIVPGLPGPPLSWVGILILYLWGKGTNGAGDPMSTQLMLILLAVMIVVSVLDYLVPGFFTKTTGGSKAGEKGALIGLFAGMFFLPPWGILIGSMAGAFIAERMVARKKTADAVGSAFGAFFGFLFGTGLKLAASGVMLYYIFVYAW